MVAAQSVRAVNAVLGALVADAAAVPSHWVYDLEKLGHALKEAKRGPAFLDPPNAGFYRVPEGHPSGYGDQVFVLLQSLAAQGKFDADDFCERLAKHFGKESVYEHTTDPENWPSLVKDAAYPVTGPWRHNCLKKFLTRYVVEGKRYPECCTPEDHLSADAWCKTVPLVARYAGKPELLTIVEAAVRITQSSDLVVQYALAYAQILELLVLGESANLSSALSVVINRLKAQDPASIPAEQLSLLTGDGGLCNLTFSEAAAKLKPPESTFAMAGIACDAPGSFLLPFYQAIKEAKEGAYEETVVGAIQGGGDSASRALLAGALAASVADRSSIPAAWVSLVGRAAEIEVLAAKVAADRESVA